MSAATDAAFQDRMAKLRTKFCERSLEQADLLDRLAETSRTAGLPPQVRSIAHTLAGSAGLYGFCDITEAAAALEDGVVAGAPTAEVLTLIDGLSRIIRHRITPAAEAASD
ncbi:Hpt domain-containing protein [Aurantimonas sp. MSK8Z-1]|uniref:Hpt domain-containing protein n=1 Tax=Mangrovibrevibacter kandeliae TaxID=2968473 RepID=UPI002117716B|nr:Hpt domain-containing protein [Aurantimonas sp. MSK8Z-1]MCW4116161.1 Hpt domain-containing protein [Aurantimonas sp. MSK8Z-1]